MKHISISILITFSLILFLCLFLFKIYNKDISFFDDSDISYKGLLYNVESEKVRIKQREYEELLQAETPNAENYIKVLDMANDQIINPEGSLSYLQGVSYIKKVLGFLRGYDFKKDDEKVISNKISSLGDVRENFPLVIKNEYAAQVQLLENSGYTENYYFKPLQTKKIYADIARLRLSFVDFECRGSDVQDPAEKFLEKELEYGFIKRILFVNSKGVYFTHQSIASLENVYKDICFIEKYKTEIASGKSLKSVLESDTFKFGL